MLPKLKKIIKEEIRKILHEVESASELYKIQGLLVTNTKVKTQSQVFSDIRSISGVTTISAKEYNPRLPKPDRAYNILTVKIDPYPYLQNGEFDKDTVAKVIEKINSIQGVRKFKAIPELVNVGV
jgi:hypothetical protein